MSRALDDMIVGFAIFPNSRILFFFAKNLRIYCLIICLQLWFLVFLD